MLGGSLGLEPGALLLEEGKNPEEGSATVETSKGVVQRMGFPWKYTIEEEYSRNPELKREDVQAIQEWMKSTGYLPSIDDELVSHFIHACFYNLEDTKKAIEYFYTSRSKMTNFFDDLDPNLPELQEPIKSDIIMARLPLPDEEGNRIFLLKFRGGCIDNFNYVNSCRWMLMSMFYNIWNLESKTGIVTIFDCKDFSVSHLWKCNLTDVRNYSNFGKYANPARIVKCVSINVNPAFKKLMFFMRPLLSKQVLDVLSVHSDPNSFFGSMPKEAVPEDYGGAAPSIEALHWEYVKILKNNAEWIMAEANIRSDETKKGGKSKKDNVDVQESLGSLEID